MCNAAGNWGWACTEDPDDCGSYFNFTAGKITQTNITGLFADYAAVSSTTASITTTATVTVAASPSASEAHGDRNHLAVVTGLGVGIPLLALLLLALGGLVMYRLRWEREKSSNLDPTAWRREVPATERSMGPALVSAKTAVLADRSPVMRPNDDSSAPRNPAELPEEPREPVELK